MPKQMIQVSLDTKHSEWSNYSTWHEQDSDSKFYDEKAASRIVELDRGTGQDLALSRTRLEFDHEHFQYFDSDYLKSIGVEDDIYSKFVQSQRFAINERTIKFCVTCNTRLEPCYFEDDTFSKLICPRCDY